MSPLYVSEFVCKSLADRWQDYSREVNAAHQECLDAHKGSPTSGSTCSVASCQGLHAEMSNDGTEAVSECRERLRRKQQEERETESERSRSVRSYDRAADTIDKAKDQADELMPDTPGNRLAQKVRDQSLDRIHARNRQTLRELDELADEVDAQLAEGRSSSSSSRPGPGTARLGSLATGVEAAGSAQAAALATRGMQEEDPYQLRRLLSEYERLTEREGCGRPCFRVMEQLKRRLREID